MPAQAAVVIGFHGRKARRQLRRRHLATLKAGNGDLKPGGGWRNRPREAVAGGELLKVAGYGGRLTMPFRLLLGLAHVSAMAGAGRVLRLQYDRDSNICFFRILGDLQRGAV